ncbi:MAG TPA: glutathione S-transferase family protein [Myxococcota bacterium]|jgi:glutathione S-transferase
MKLYELAPTRSIRVRWTLQELGVPFEAVRVDLAAGEHRTPEFLALNPAGKVPVLVDGDLVLTESAAIPFYLADKFPEKGLLPSDAAGRGEAYRWSLFAVTELEQPLWRIQRHTALYPEADRIPADVALASREARAAATILDDHLKGREFVAGRRVSVADFIVAYTLDWASARGLLDHCPSAGAYVERMYARPLAAPRIVAARASLQSA